MRGLGTHNEHYSQDPRRNNTVPGQFSAWLHGETLTNQGMMLSPWFPPRYLWAAIEGAAGLDLSGSTPKLEPRLAPDWLWIGVKNVPLGGKRATWFVARADEQRMYSNVRFDQSTSCETYEEDVSDAVHLSGYAAVAVALRRNADFVIFVGNTMDRTASTAVRLDLKLQGSYAVRSYNSLRGEWIEERLTNTARLHKGVAIQLDRKGFCAIELRQED